MLHNALWGYTTQRLHWDGSSWPCPQFCRTWEDSWDRHRPPWLSSPEIWKLIISFLTSTTIETFTFCWYQQVSLCNNQSLRTSDEDKSFTVTLPPSFLRMVHLTYSSLASVTYAALLASKGALWDSSLSFSGLRRKIAALPYKAISASVLMVAAYCQTKLMKCFDVSHMLKWFLYKSVWLWSNNSYLVLLTNEKSSSVSL